MYENHTEYQSVTEIQTIKQPQ